MGSEPLARRLGGFGLSGSAGVAYQTCHPEGLRQLGIRICSQHLIGGGLRDAADHLMWELSGDSGGATVTLHRPVRQPQTTKPLNRPLKLTSPLASQER